MHILRYLLALGSNQGNCSKIVTMKFNYYTFYSKQLLLIQFV